jgi:prepilin-type N-terminal cleavage/methylation domain-containing protein
MFKVHKRRARIRNSARGLTLIELMVAMAILATGMAALLGLVVTAAGNNNKAKVDTGGTLVAQMVIEQMLAQPAANALTITDCAGTDSTINTVSANSPGAGAQLSAAGAIDYTQTYANAPANYKMQFRSCGTTGGWTTYDVRWNVTRISDRTKLVTVSARPNLANSPGNYAKAKLFQVPVNLKTIVVNIN